MSLPQYSDLKARLLLAGILVPLPVIQSWTAKHRRSIDRWLVYVLAGHTRRPGRRPKMDDQLRLLREKTRRELGRPNWLALQEDFQGKFNG